jgi:hypothetical protein
MVIVKVKTAAAIREAIDEAAQGDTVVLSPGEYRLSKPVYVREGVKIMGQMKR